MQFSQTDLYHVYNRGNNQQRIFFRPENFSYFLEKVKKYLLPYCDMIAWCLMPTHFHFLVNADNRTLELKKVAGQERNIFSEGIRNLLSSYTQAINKQNKTTGSLFQQNTKSKSISQGSNLYDRICLHYIHQNPLKANLVRKMEDWEYSSFRGYCGLDIDKLCNKETAIQLLNLDLNNFYEESYRVISDGDIGYIL